MITDMDQATRAKEWLEGAKSKWRLQTMQHRGRYDMKTGKYVKLPVKLRRFLNGTPVGMIGETLRQLVDMAPYATPVYNWEYDSGLEYRPVNTFIIKDGTANVTNAKDATYTIVQDLRIVGEDDELDLVDSTSCSQVTTAEYHWDEASVEDCPEASQGVSWQVANVSRDSESDLFSYVLRKSVAVTQHKPEDTVACSDRQRVTVETWDNVYGELGDWKCDAVVNGSAAIEIPYACDAASGTKVEVSMTENPDCTFKVEVRRTYAKSADGIAYSAYRDQYKIQQTIRDVNAASGLAKEGTEYGGGLTTKYSSERNEDGTWNNTTETERERPVEKSTFEYRVTPRGITTTRTDSNQQSAASKLVGDFGHYKFTKTPGGLYTNEYLSFEHKKDVEIAISCEDTLFLHTHESSSTAEKMEDGHVDPAKDGVVNSVQFDMDELGAITRRERTRTEHTVERSKATVRSTTRGTSTSVESRSMKAEGEAPSKYGTTVSERTDGALWNVVKEVFASSEGVTVGVSESDTAFVAVRSDSLTHTAVPTGSLPAPGAGIHWERESSVDENGGVVTRLVKRAEHEVVGSEVTVRRTPRGLVTTTKSRSTAKPSVPEAVGRSATWSLTEGARYDTAEEVFETSEGATLSVSCEKTALRHEHAETKASETAVADAEAAGPGWTRGVRCTASDQGGYDVQVSYVEHFAASVSFTSHSSKLRQSSSTRYRNAKAVPATPSLGEASFSINENGTYDGEVTALTLLPDQATYSSELTKLRNSSTVSYTNLDSPLPATGPIGHASANEDQNGKWSGSVTTVTLIGDEGTFSSEVSKLRSSSTVSYVNADAPRDVTGDLGHASANEDQNGKWSGSVTTVTLKSDDGTYVSMKTKLREESTKHYTNYDQPLDTTGAIGHATSSEDQNGKWSGSVTTVTLLQDSKTFVSETNHLVTRRTTSYVNADAPMDAGTDSNASASEDQNGKWSGQSSSETPIPHQETIGPYTSTETSPYGKGTITVTRTWKAIVFVNQATVPNLAPSSGQGQATYGVSASYNKYGLLDGKIECTQVRKQWDDGSSSGTGNKNIRSPAYKTKKVIQTFLGIDPSTRKPSYAETEIETTHEIGLRCENLPQTMFEGSQVAMTKDKLYNYHAITAKTVTYKGIKAAT